MRRDYATGLSKQYLEYLGVTSVSEDGKEIYKNGKLVKIHNDGNYNLITFYDPILRESIPKDLRTNASG